LCFGIYLIPNEEKQAKKFETGLNSCIKILTSYFDIQNFSQLVDRASIYEESLKEDAAEYIDKKMMVQEPCTSAGGAKPTKRMAVGSFTPQRSEGHTFGNRPVPPQRNQMLEVYKKCNRAH
jgi:hypothetical protein